MEYLRVRYSKKLMGFQAKLCNNCDGEVYLDTKQASLYCPCEEIDKITIMQIQKQHWLKVKPECDPCKAEEEFLSDKRLTK